MACLTLYPRIAKQNDVNFSSLCSRQKSSFWCTLAKLHVSWHCRISQVGFSLKVQALSLGHLLHMPKCFLQPYAEKSNTLATWKTKDFALPSFVTKSNPVVGTSKRPTVKKRGGMALGWVCFGCHSFSIQGLNKSTTNLCSPSGLVPTLEQRYPLGLFTAK